MEIGNNRILNQRYKLLGLRRFIYRNKKLEKYSMDMAH
jgi:hypothetical protein